MKTTAIIFAFFLEYFLLETRDALPMNGLEDLTRGQTISRGHLPLFSEISHRARANLRKQTASKTEDMSGSNAGGRFVTTLFHGTVSGETNLRKFPKVLSKAQVQSNMKGVDEGFVSKRIRRSLSQPQEGLGSHLHSSQSLSVRSSASLKPSSLTEPTPTTKTIKSSAIKSSPESSDAVISYANITRSITSHTSIEPLLSSQAISSSSKSTSPNPLLLMSSAVTNRIHPASSTSSYVSTTTLSTTRSSPLKSPSYMSSSSTTHTPQVKPTHSSIAPMLLTSSTHQSPSASVSSSVAASDDSSKKSSSLQTRHKKKKTPIPYWSIAVSGIGCIFVIMAAYLIWKLRRQTHGDTQGPLPDLSQGESNPVYDGDEMPLPQLRIS